MSARRDIQALRAESRPLPRRRRERVCRRARMEPADPAERAAAERAATERGEAATAEAAASEAAASEAADAEAAASEAAVGEEAADAEAAAGEAAVGEEAAGEAAGEEAAGDEPGPPRAGGSTPRAREVASPVEEPPQAHGDVLEQPRHTVGGSSGSRPIVASRRTPSSEADARPRGMGWFASKPRAWKRQLMRRPWVLPVAAMQLAAMLIQKAWRASWLRWGAWRPGAGRDWSRQRGSQPVGSACGAGAAAVAEPPARRRSRPEVIDGLHRSHLELLKWQCGAGAERKQNVRTFQDFCALKIQAMWRATSKVGRRRRMLALAASKVPQVAAFEIQRTWRLFRVQIAERRAGARPLTPSQVKGVEEAWGVNEAAAIIQRCWQGHQRRRVFESLRDVVAGFRNTGDPYLLLRTVLPRESMLLDPAMQAHVRFRLAGSRFPPTIYYKVFTHGAVCDVGAFAPRNYAAGQAPGQPASGRGDWYVRQENNGWRPLAAPHERVDGKPIADEVEATTARKVVKDFHFSRLRRRQDLDRKRRQRTVAWMRKMYGMQATSPAIESSYDGSPQSDEPSQADAASPRLSPASAGAALLEDVRETPVLEAEVAAQGQPGPEPAAPRPSPAPPQPAGGFAPKPPQGPPTGRPVPQVAASRKRVLLGSVGYGAGASIGPPGSSQGWSSPGGVRDDEVQDDELLEWTSQLDFEAYMEGWQAAATSAGSEGTLPIRGPPLSARGPYTATAGRALPIGGVPLSAR